MGPLAQVGASWPCGLYDAPWWRMIPIPEPALTGTDILLTPDA
jgi:hypothetical protein